MNISALKNRATSLGLDSRIVGGSTKILIRNIQQAQGHEPCFMTEKWLDCQEHCEYRRECRRLTAAWLR